jgi:hypothetical protein
MTQPRGGPGLTWTTQNPFAPALGGCACGWVGIRFTNARLAASPDPLTPTLRTVCPAADNTPPVLRTPSVHALGHATIAPPRSCREPRALAFARAWVGQRADWSTMMGQPCSVRTGSSRRPATWVRVRTRCGASRASRASTRWPGRCRADRAARQSRGLASGFG